MQFAFLLHLLIAAAPSVTPPAPEQIFFGWGVLEDAGAGKCYAMALPEISGRKRRFAPSAAIAFWRSRSGSPQIHFRLSETKRPGAAVILRIDERVFQLLSGGSDAWAPERATAAIIAAMRTGMIMTIETRTAGGRRMRGRYQLRGAATAIDGAAIACSRIAEAGKKPQ